MTFTISNLVSNLWEFYHRHGPDYGGFRTTGKLSEFLLAKTYMLADFPALIILLLCVFVLNNFFLILQHVTPSVIVPLPSAHKDAAGTTAAMTSLGIQTLSPHSAVTAPLTVPTPTYTNAQGQWIGKYL